jgi:hypothetical protein
VRRRGEPLACAACGFDFERIYGKRGTGYIECHYVIPLHETGERRVTISDLALLCSNCHRMIHAKPPAVLVCVPGTLAVTNVESMSTTNTGVSLAPLMVLPSHQKRM